MTPVPTPLATPTPEPTKSPTPVPTPTSTPSPTKTPIPTATTVPAESPEPKCGENFILKDDECICERESFILRGGNCYPVCGTKAAFPDSSKCICPYGYEKNDFGSCSKRCTMKYAHLSKFGECECDENFIKKNSECICNEKDDELIGDKCLHKPGKHEKRVINGDVVDYICEPGYEYDKNRVCQKVTSKRTGLLGWLFGGSRSNSMPTPIATPEVTLPTPTSNPAPTASTLEKQKKKEQPKQKPKVKKECYNIKNGDRIIQFDNGKTICQNFLLGKVRDCVEECPDDKD